MQLRKIDLSHHNYISPKSTDPKPQWMALSKWLHKTVVDNNSNSKWIVHSTKEATTACFETTTTMKAVMHEMWNLWSERGCCRCAFLISFCLCRVKHCSVIIEYIFYFIHSIYLQNKKNNLFFILFEYWMNLILQPKRWILNLHSTTTWYKSTMAFRVKKCQNVGCD